LIYISAQKDWNQYKFPKTLTFYGIKELRNFPSVVMQNLQWPVSRTYTGGSAPGFVTRRTTTHLDTYFRRAIGAVRRILRLAGEVRVVVLLFGGQPQDGLGRKAPLIGQRYHRVLNVIR